MNDSLITRFIEKYYYDSEAENQFTISMMAEGAMSEYGTILDDQGHYFQVQDWIDCLPCCDLDLEFTPEEQKQLSVDLNELLESFRKKVNKMYKGKRA